MKLLPFLLSMMFSGIAFTQDISTRKVMVETKNIFIGASFSSDYCYRTVINNDDDPSVDFIVELRNENEVPKFGYSGGLKLLYNFSNHFGMEAGVQFSNKGYAWGKSDLYFGDVVDPRYGFVYSTLNSSETPVNAKFKYNYLYLDLPVRAIYTWGEKRLRFTTSIGFDINYLLKSTQTSIVEYENGDIRRETSAQMFDDYFKFNLSPTVSAGIDYRLSDKFSLKAEPTFRYGVFKISDTPISAYLWSGGLNVSCYYVLR